MKIRIAEEYPGEVSEKRDELHRVVDELAGVTKSDSCEGCCETHKADLPERFVYSWIGSDGQRHTSEPLEKAQTPPLASGAQFEHPALEGSVKAARGEMDAVRKEMERQIAAVLNE